MTTTPDPSTAGLLWAALLWLGRIAGGFVVVCSILPFIRSGWWVVRVCDFPRLQLAGVGLFAIALLLTLSLASAHRTESLISAAVVALVIAWQLSHVLPYTPLWRTSVPSADSADITLLVANLDFENHRHAEALDTLRTHDPDLLLLVEIDQTWSDALAPIRARYSHHVETIRDEGLGIALWSRAPIESASIEHLVSDDRPSIHATLKLGEHTVRFVGVHPTPPALQKQHADDRHDSRIRDAELVIVARRITDADLPAIVAGDFNDVAWSHTTRLFQRLSGLLDPRIGRGLFSTFHAQYPLLRYPLDHVFISEGMHVTNLERVRIEGSDHFAMFTSLHLTSHLPPPSERADTDDREEASEITAEGKQDAASNGDR